MTSWLSPQEQQAWRGFLRMHTGLTTRFNRELQTGGGLSVADYDVLVALTDVRDRSLRMGELGRALGWEKGRLSKHITRMAARGLVARRECPDDLRGAYVDLTPAGRAAIDEAAPEHVALVRSLVFDQLSSEEVAALATITTKVLERIGQQTQ